MNARTTTKESNFNRKDRTLSKRQVICTLLVPVCGISLNAINIATACVLYRRGVISKTKWVSWIVVGVVFIILVILLAIIRILYKRNQVLRRSLNVEKVRLCVTNIELDRQIMSNKIKNVEKEPEATILPNYEVELHYGLFVEKPASALKESDTIQEYKPSVSIESKI